MARHALALVSCPLCAEPKNFLELSIPDGDDHLAGYGDLYEGQAKSDWKACGKCGFVHQNPRPSAEALNEFYRRGAYHKKPTERKKLSTIQYSHRGAYDDNHAFLARHLPLTTGAVVDIGCGYGLAMVPLQKSGWRCYGIEPDAVYASVAREDLGLTGVQVGLADENLALPEQVDLVMSHHAFEHVADLEGVMKGVTRSTKPGGYFFARLPTYYRNRSRMSKLYMNSGHYSMFTHASLMQLLSRFGYEYVAHQYLSKAGIGVTDDFMLLARYTGKLGQASTWYESPAWVKFYVNVVNPLRSVLFSPVYALCYRGLLRSARKPAFKLVKALGLR